jgi:2TM domain
MSEHNPISESGYRGAESMDEVQLRKAATKRLEDRRGLQAHALAYVLVNGFLSAIWLFGGGGFFWPIFPIFGWGIGLAFHVWAIVSPEPSEERIRAEMRRIAGQD